MSSFASVCYVYAKLLRYPGMLTSKSWITSQRSAYTPPTLTAGMHGHSSKTSKLHGQV